MFAGGKRLRPILCLAAAEACGGSTQDALPAACAVECIHTYSLIHDDLPSMDNDDLRRGKPTCHKVFGEAVAILAGDALLTLAFEVLATAPTHPRHPLRMLLTDLSNAAGSLKLIAGQVADLEAEGKKVSPTQLRFIHESKTAALLTCAIRLGAMSAGAPPSKLDRLTTFGHALGLAFQVIDDILDVTQSSETLGKSAGKDLAADKATYPSVLGLDRSRREAEKLTARALDAVSGFGKKGEPLRALASHLLCREF